MTTAQIDRIQDLRRRFLEIQRGPQTVAVAEELLAETADQRRELLDWERELFAWLETGDKTQEADHG